MGVREQVDELGFAVCDGVVSQSRAKECIESLTAVSGPGAVDRRGSLMAVRNLFEEVTEIRELARSPEVRSLAEEILGAECFAVRAILFDKTPDANWKVAWHQDLTIAVRRKHEVAGFGPWSEKTGIQHVQPPAQVLARMITVRVHLDPCGPENGPLNVLPSSHLAGRLNAEEIDRLRTSQDVVSCVVGVGGALIMRPLLLHASSAATKPDHRRVVHLDYAAEDLPGGLDWYERW